MVESGSGLVSAPPANCPPRRERHLGDGGKSLAFGYDIEISMVAYVRETWIATPADARRPPGTWFTARASGWRETRIG
jgi:hypothetical protein